MCQHYHVSARRIAHFLAAAVAEAGQEGGAVQLAGGTQFNWGGYELKLSEKTTAALAAAGKASRGTNAATVTNNDSFFDMSLSRGRPAGGRLGFE